MRADRAKRDSEHGEWESPVTGHAEGRSTRIMQRHFASGEQKTTLEWKPSKREEERKTTAPEHGRKLSRRGSMRLWRDTEKHHHSHSIQFSRSVVSNSLWPHGLQHARLPCPSPTTRACSSPPSRWCHPNFSSSVISFPSCLLSFPASGSFPMSQFFVSGGQSIGVSASASVLPMNIQDWFPFRLTAWISLLSKGLSRDFFNITVQKHQFLSIQPSLQYNSHLYMTTGKTIALTTWIFVDKVISLLFNMLSRLVITFLPRSKCLLISWL